VAKSGPKSYGSCIAFEPGIVQLGAFEGGKAGLEEAVYTSGRFTELALVNRNDHVGGKSIYSPYAYNCSSDRIDDDACSTIDLAWQYDYSSPGTTWFLEPRRLFLEAQAGRRAFEGRMFPGVWTEPYFDAGAGNINMTTFSVAFGTDQGEFLGVCTIDVAVESLCWTNCSLQARCALHCAQVLAMVRERSAQSAGVFVRDRELHDRRRPLSGMPAGFELGGRQRFCVHTMRPRFALGSGLCPMFTRSMDSVAGVIFSSRCCRRTPAHVCRLLPARGGPIRLP
jgi:hypothetical protein